jgi:phosphatidylserine/phosphatidylglycerophosphate/cardiolipin synthase-like enzyme
VKAIISKKTVSTAARLGAGVLALSLVLTSCSSSPRSTQPPVKIPASNIPIALYTIDPSQPAVASAFEVFTPPGKNTDWLYRLVLLAKHNISISANQLSDPNLIKLLNWQAQGGVKVQVLLNNQSSNKTAFNELQGGGSQVEYAKGNLLQSTITLDGMQSIISATSFDARAYSTSRSFGVIDHDPRDVKGIVATFNADWASSSPWSQGAKGPHLTWSPGGVGPTVAFIASARSSLLVETELLSSQSVIAALSAAAHRGVSVSVVVGAGRVNSATLTSLAQSGVKVGVLPSSVHTIDGNALVADGNSVSFGSQSLSNSGLVTSRALNLTFVNDTVGVASAMEAVMQIDLSEATPFTPGS